MATNWLSYDEILKMKRVEEMLEVYYNSGQFEITIQILRHKYSSAFEMFQRLGDYYENKGLFGMSHSRIKRCEILMDFVKEEFSPMPDGEEILECIRQGLVFDLYYRENSKSRPVWAGDMGEFKKITHYYCKNGKMSHIEPFDYDFLGNLQEFPRKADKAFWVLYSYDKRDPLNHQAQAEYVYPEVDMTEGE